MPSLEFPSQRQNILLRVLTTHENQLIENPEGTRRGPTGQRASKRLTA